MRKLFALAVFLAASCLAGCSSTGGHSTGVYMLIDTSGTYAVELNKANSIVKYLLGTLQPGDSLAVASIDSGSFTEKNILEKATFNTRPSVANQQKRAFGKKIEEYIAHVRGSSHTDITGGVLQGVEYLNETGAGRKYIFIFSDLEEDLAKGQIRDFPIRFNGIRVVALNVTKLRKDNIDPRDYEKRLVAWQKRVESGKGHWKVINDIERVEEIMLD
ncbi:MAG TPA: VWA domain-containing protein [Thermodesulfobacteriota bacterium]|nr:VWA domain-containing protein [Thermodesulfobacteriota bacterium]